jgi:dolichol-phosphate mannosyltransferase
MKAVVCLPAYNEIESIRIMIEKIRAEGLEVWVSDGGSTDGTKEVAREMGVRLLERPGRGKAFGVREALLAAARDGYDVLFTIDCDNTYPVEKIPEMLGCFPESDLVLGIRDMRSISFIRRMVNRFHSGLLSFLSGKQFQDVNTGLRGYRCKLFAEKMESNWMELEVESCFKAVKAGWKIREIPVSYASRMGESTAGIKDFIEITGRIIREYRRK